MINNPNDITNFEYLIYLLSEEHICKIAEKYKGDENTKSFFTKDYLKLFMFAEAKAIESLRGMESVIKHDKNLQKIVLTFPIHSAISRNDSERNSEIFVDIFNLVAETLLSIPNKFSDGNTKYFEIVKILDSSTVMTSLKLFPWANYKSGISGINIHTLFDLAHSSPEK